MKETGGTAEDCTDQEIIDAIKLLAETEGIFAETAGGVTMACAQKLIERGRIPRHESIVLCITGHGLKTQEAVIDKVGSAKVIRPTMKDFESLLEQAIQTP
jgi:threonine synthase